MHVLVVEDDNPLRRSLAAALRAHGLRVHDTADGASALRAVRSMAYDVVLLDLGLPDADGIELLPRLRVHHAGPVIVVSARRDQSDKVAALDAGADDYLTKPFGLPELLARIRAQARRAGVGGSVHAGGAVIDLDKQRVTNAAGDAVALSATEWAVLKVLVAAAGAPVPTDDLLREVWGDDAGDRDHNVRVYVSLLRRKLEADPSSPRVIINEPGRGYRLGAE